MVGKEMNTNISEESWGSEKMNTIIWSEYFLRGIDLVSRAKELSASPLA